MKRIVFMGTPEFAVPSLKLCIENFEVCALYCQPDRPVGRGLETKAPPTKVLANLFGIPVFQPEKASTPEEIKRLKELKPDFIVVVAYGQILKKEVLEIPKIACVNVHSSLLPRWRGAAPIHRALLAGDTETGVTTMLIGEKLDAGDILLQDKTVITSDETAQSLHDRLAEMGSHLLVKTLSDWDLITPQKQNESEVTIAKKLTKDLEKIDPSEEALVLDRKIRSLNPWPGSSLFLEDGKRLKVKKASISFMKINVGELTEKDGKLLLGTQKGSLELHEVQWEGKKPQSAENFINGVYGSGLNFPFLVKRS